MPNEGQKTPTTRKTSRRQKASSNRRMVQRGLVAQISTALFQPITFYETLPTMRQTRQWLWVGFIILALIGLSAVQQATSEPTTTNVNTDIPITDPFGGGGEVIISPDAGGGFDFGAPPIDPNAPVTPEEPGQTVNNWTTALVAASQLVLMWGVLSVMLIVLPMFKGNPPQVGENLQIAIYSSLPLGVMAVLQLIYIAAGGVMGKAGLSGLVDEIPAYATADPFIRSMMLSVLSQTTLFMLWSLLMVYFGGRVVLGGHRLVVFLVVVAWVALLIIMPVVTGAIQAESMEVETDAMIDDLGAMPDIIPSDIEGLMNPFEEMPSDSEMPMIDMTPEPEMTAEADMMPMPEMTPEPEITPPAETRPVRRP